MIQCVSRSLCVVAFSLLLAAASLAQELLVAPENGKGVYQPGQTIRWTMQVKGAAEVSEAAYVIKKGGISELAKGKAALTDSKGMIEAKLDEPGWLLAEVTIKTTDGKQLKAAGGALVSPEKIQPALPRPNDFDAFWEGKLKELAAIPMNAKLESGDAGKPNVDYFTITMDNISGSHIRGQLARPQKGDKFPALLVVQWAGVYALQKGWVADRAAEGWLALNINAHDLPIAEPAKFYTDQNSGPLKDYPAIGNDNRDTSYFLRMYLSCYRAAQYLSERPDWDGRTLVVTGGSQGGLQSIVTAALHPKITGVMACVPAGCDLNGPQAGRQAGWPSWYWATKGKDEAKVREAACYYDVVNFASCVKCPVLIGVGLIDTTCPSPGVFAAYNQLQGPNEIVVLPVAEHGEKKGSHGPYYARFGAWNQALLKGKPAPTGSAGILPASPQKLQ
ncbi:MAG: acetylxylan esterase [Candidatus Sumerlaeota bacterium]|nr:acetylxylan esterase [Candidatus Sumerlaeota bacterium]